MALREAWWFHTVSETLQDAIKPLRERGVFREDCLSALCEFRSDTPFTGRLAAGLGDGVGPPGRVNIIVAITSGAVWPSTRICEELFWGCSFMASP